MIVNWKLKIEFNYNYKVGANERKIFDIFARLNLLHLLRGRNPEIAPCWRLFVS